jgi:hypothetical protein
MQLIAYRLQHVETETMCSVLRASIDQMSWTENGGEGFVQPYLTEGYRYVLIYQTPTNQTSCEAAVNGLETLSANHPDKQQIL